MSKSRLLLPRYLMAAALLAALSVAAPAFADDHANNNAPDHTAKAFDKSDTSKEPVLMRGNHVEGHIAFLHTELGITPEQEPLWTPVADAIRQDVADMQKAEAQVDSEYEGHESAVQYLHNRAMFANLRAEGEARFYNAILPLYDRLSDEQKTIADDLFVPTDTAQ